MKSVAILPAAGLSRRLGEPKLLKQLDGKPLINHTLAAWNASQVNQLVVVIRANDQKLHQHLLVTAQHESLDIVLADPPPPEMKDSVLAGIEHIQRETKMNPQDVLLVAPSDMPYLSAAVINALLAAHQPDTPVILTPQYRGRRGHPALFPWTIAESVCRLNRDQGLNALWDLFPNRTITVPSDRSFVDLDTSADWNETVTKDPSGKSDC